MKAFASIVWMVFGIGIVWISVLLTGGGHGTYLPLFLALGPWSWILFLFTSALAEKLFWIGIVIGASWWPLAWSLSSCHPKTFISASVLGYLSLVRLFLSSEASSMDGPFADLRKATVAVPWMVGVFFAGWIAAQFLLWRSCSRANTKTH